MFAAAATVESTVIPFPATVRFCYSSATQNFSIAPVWGFLSHSVKGETLKETQQDQVAFSSYYRNM